MSHFRRYGFLYILLALFLGSWAAQAVTQWQEFASEQSAHGDPALTADFLWAFGAATFENWQSEFLQLLVQAFGMYVIVDRIFTAANEDMNRIEGKIDGLYAQIGGVNTFLHRHDKE